VDIIGAQAFGFELTKLHSTTWISTMVASSCPEVDEPEFRHISVCGIKHNISKKSKLHEIILMCMNLLFGRHITFYRISVYSIFPIICMQIIQFSAYLCAFFKYKTAYIHKSRLM
jgi:hypothetical protein